MTILCTLLTALLITPAAEASPRLALVVGVNQAVDEDLPALRFADDDALAFADLFNVAGVETWVVTRPDQDTRALRPEVNGMALYEPTREGLSAALEKVLGRITEYLEAGQEPELLFAYAGHGNVKGRVGYITLEDARLTGADLERELVSKLGASRVHLIIDACYSVFLAYHRGAGGERRPAAGFSQLSGLLQNPRVGLLLSTSATNLTHEWERFGAGVFGHLVRSGLYGAADVNGDDVVTYRELAAFVHGATESITNRRYRPSVFAKPPPHAQQVLRLHDSAPRLRIAPTMQGRYLVEDERGVRFIDFHVGAVPLTLMRPSARATLFVRDWESGKEREITGSSHLVEVATLPTQSRPVASRGSADRAMEEILTIPFNSSVVAGYRFPATSDLMALEVPEDPLPVWRLVAGWGSIVAGTAAAATALAFTLAGFDMHSQVGAGASHQDVVAANRSIGDQNLRTGIMVGVSVGAVITGLGLLLWPSSAPETGLEVTP